MAAEPEQREVGVGLAREHRLEVELDVRLAGEGDVVAQQPQRQSVGDDAPQPLAGAVQQLLNEAVRGLVGGATDTGGTSVERDAAPTRWIGEWLYSQKTGVALAVDLDAGLLNEPAVAELREQRQQPRSRVSLPA